MGWMTRVQCPAVAGIFSLHHLIQTGSGAQTTSYPVGTGGSFSRSKATEAWSWQLASI